MPRPPRQLVDQGFYHVIARGNNRLFILDMMDEFQTFKGIISDSKKQFKWKLYHYCLMSDHVHLLAQVERGKDLPKLMQFLLQGYSRWYKTKYDYIGHLWQGRYKSPLIEKESYMLECGRYIERNPVRANIVNRPEDYPWSSYRFYAIGETDPLVDEDPYFQSFGLSAQKRMRQYKEFVRIESPYNAIISRSLAGNAI